MERKAYTEELHSLLNDAHALTMRLHNLIDQIGPHVHGAERQTLSVAVRFAGGASDVLYHALYPEPSALDDDEPAPVDMVDMVCVACRKPAEPVSGHIHSGWQHKTDDDAVDCPASGSPVVVMVAAGNENVPNSFQEDQNRLARKLADPDRTDWDFEKSATSRIPRDA